MRQGTQGWCTGMTLRDGMGKEVGGSFRMGLGSQLAKRRTVSSRAATAVTKSNPTISGEYPRKQFLAPCPATAHAQPLACVVSAQPLGTAHAASGAALKGSEGASTRPAGLGMWGTDAGQKRWPAERPTAPGRRSERSLGREDRGEPGWLQGFLVRGQAGSLTRLKLSTLNV